MRTLIIVGLILFNSCFGSAAIDLVQANTTSSHDFRELRQIAEDSLKINIVNLGSDHYLAAGANQFRTLWTRDFNFSSRGLFLIGRSDAVRDHLKLLFKHKEPKTSLVPRVIDSIPVKYRVLKSLSSNVLKFIPRPPDLNSQLVPEYKDEHGTQASDSNILTVLTALEYFVYSHDVRWWSENVEQIALIFKQAMYLINNSGLVRQAPFSDWQDSVSREGYTSYLHVLYAKTLNKALRYKEFNLKPVEVRQFTERALNLFYDQNLGVYRALSDQSQIGLESNLFILESQLGAKNRLNSIYAHLKLSSLWINSSLEIPGFPTSGNYLNQKYSLAVKWSHMKNYHQDIYWSWLMALSAKVAWLYGDCNESKKILGILSNLAIRDQAIGEIYSPKSDFPLHRTWIYRSEIPFSWGASYVLDAIHTVNTEMCGKYSQ